MTNIEKYNRTFQESFGVSVEELLGLHYKGISSWDSVGHMSLIASVEEVFDIDLSSDDIIDFSSYEKGKEILKKYNIDL